MRCKSNVLDQIVEPIPVAQIPTHVRLRPRVGVSERAGWALGGEFRRAAQGAMRMSMTLQWVPVTAEISRVVICPSLTALATAP